MANRWGKRGNSAKFYFLGLRGDQRMRRLDGISDAMNINLGKLREMVRGRESWHASVHEVAKSWT